MQNDRQAQPIQEIRWNPAPPDLRLAMGEVHVWMLRGIDAGSLPNDLTVAERDEVARQRLPAGRQLLFASRVLRRQVLSRYVSIAPPALQFEAGPDGKPALKGEPAIEFNTSHSGDLALLAVSGSPVGIDLEKLRAGVRCDELARRFFPPDFAQPILAATGPEKEQRFFQTWTEVESILKARGVGLAKGLHSLSKGGWVVRHFVPAPGYIGAVAAGDPLSRVEFYQWEIPKNSGTKSSSNPDRPGSA